MPDPAALFADAATTVADLVDRLAPDAWDGPGLGEWDLRALVGHTSRSLVTVLTYLDRPVDEERVGDAVEYYALIKSGALPVTADPAAVVERGRQAGAQLGDDPAAAFRALLAPLVVHGLDISAATGEPVAFAPDVLGDALGLAAAVAVRLGEGVPVLLALTGRRPLPVGFCVV